MNINPNDFVTMAANVPGGLAIFERIGGREDASSWWTRIDGLSKRGYYRMDVHPKTLAVQFGPATEAGEMIKAFDRCEIIDGETE